MSAALTSLPLYRIVLVGSVIIAGLLLALPAWRLAGAVEAYHGARELHASVASRVRPDCLSGVSSGEALTALLEQRWGGNFLPRHESVSAIDGRCRAHELQIDIRTTVSGLEQMLADLAREGPLSLRDLQCESREAGHIDCRVELVARLQAAS
ncbi:hypothetical protein GCM10007420_27210 [Glycocaulis albus]|uniref:Uncharacterized protein n=1 Tax=Glycocaulis albus TaxID=1382801 RepID=A0ABQ1Y176_9PROT|nr:hypothetical protein [Glycocaulis albus]GGH08949.1 hypothetical protein GCM10007420_27210 [Glycocaulis albus]